MFVRPFFASGQGIIPLMVAGYCILGCAVGGLILVWKAKKTSLWLVGAGLCLCSLVILILSLANFDKLIRLF
jgi:hypothetical protein